MIDIDLFLRLVQQSLKQWQVPVVGQLADEGSDPFIILIACILSLRTRDQTTAEAGQRLFALSSDPWSMSAMEVKKIEEAIFPVGFFRIKAKHIQAISHKICKVFNGTTPDTLEDLLTLPGVGRKTANLVLTIGHNKPGICVDTHVHRICNRWGYVVTKDPDKTEQILRKKLPKKFWIPLNGLLVPFGQNQCTPTSPKCSSCYLHDVCEKVGVSLSR